jgi:hypothetical protein
VPAVAGQVASARLDIVGVALEVDPQRIPGADIPTRRPGKLDRNRRDRARRGHGNHRMPTGLRSAARGLDPGASGCVVAGRNSVFRHSFSDEGCCRSVSTTIKVYFNKERLVATQVIVVGPAEVWRNIVQSVDVGCHVVAFSTLEELDRWRENQGLEDPSVYPDLVVALIETGCRLGSLPVKLRGVLETMGHEATVLPLRLLEEHWPSRRSFYRTWDSHISIAPAAFLRRVRALHARRLLANGRTKKEAALLAGYSSVDQMRRNIQRSDDES